MSYSPAYDTAYDGGIVPAPPTVGPLTVFREAVATALAVIPEVVAGDWQVLPVAVDMLEPPAFMVVHGPDPWGTVATVCADTVTLEVVVVADRLTPDANYPVIEAMVDQARIALAAGQLRPFQWLASGPFEIGQVTYLAARLQIRQPVTLGAP